MYQLTLQQSTMVRALLVIVLLMAITSSTQGQQFQICALIRDDCCYQQCGEKSFPSAISGTCKLKFCGETCRLLCRFNDNACKAACDTPACVQFDGICRQDTLTTYRKVCPESTCTQTESFIDFDFYIRKNYTIRNTVNSPPTYTL